MSCQSKATMTHQEKSQCISNLTRLAVRLIARKAKTSRLLLCSIAVLLQFAAPARSQPCPYTINFGTFVTATNINSAEGQNKTIAFNYAGNKFVGSVYFDNQLYQTGTTGIPVATFGSPLPDSSSSVGEVVLAASLGQGGFPTGDVYVGSQDNSNTYRGNIYHYANSGGAPALFATVPTGVVRQILFDPGTSFGGNMLVTTNVGDIYEITSAAAVSLLASVGEDTEGMDIATSAWGGTPAYAGDLLVSSEGSGTIRLIDPSGNITVVLSLGSFPHAETIGFVPLNLNPADPLQGFYVANFPVDIQFAAANNFVNCLGDAIVTDETGGSTAWDVHYDNNGTFTQTPLSFTGNPITQFEDGIFVIDPGREAGYVEVCKQSNPAFPVTGTFKFQVTGVVGTVSVPVGECSGAMLVPAGSITISETPPAGITVSDVTAYSFDQNGNYVDQLVSWTAPSPTATVNIVSGGVSLETIATFTNSSAGGKTGELKICKIAGTGVEDGTPFNFSTKGTGIKGKFTIEAGPASQGGNCELAGTYPLGTQMTVSEAVPRGIYASIQVQPPANGSHYTATSVKVTIGEGITEVDFTDSTQKPVTATLSPSKANFGKLKVRTTGMPKTFTLTNNGTGVMNISSIVIGGTNPGDFVITATTCGATLAGGANCTINVSFSPTALGPRTAQLIVTDDATNSPQVSNLSGTGV